MLTPTCKPRNMLTLDFITLPYIWFYTCVSPASINWNSKNSKILKMTSPNQKKSCVEVQLRAGLLEFSC